MDLRIGRWCRESLSSNHNSQPLVIQSYIFVCIGVIRITREETVDVSHSTTKLCHKVHVIIIVNDNDGDDDDDSISHIVSQCKKLAQK